MSRWEDYEYDDLVNILSDYHKDVFGYRLRMNEETKEAVIQELVYLDRYMEKMKSTPEGRAQLEAEGWSFEDSKESV